MIFIYYKHKVAGPFNEISDEAVQSWKILVDSGKMNNLPDTPVLNEDMELHPNDVHYLFKSPSSSVG